MTIRPQRYLATLSTVVGIIVGLTVWWNQCHEPQYSLNADVRFGPLPTLPHVDQLSDMVLELRSVVLARQWKLQLTTESGDKSTDEALREISELLQNSSIRESILAIDRHNGYWLATVYNDGELPVTDVSLRLPGAEILEIRKSTAQIEIIEDSSIAHVDTLRPKESVVVSAWTLSEPSYFDTEKLSLSHTSGIGKVHVKLAPGWTRYRVSNFLFRWWWTFFLLPIFLWIVTALLGHIARSLENKASAEASTPEAITHTERDETESVARTTPK